MTIDFVCILEQRGPPSGTNSAKQSPAPQHRPLELAPINPDRLGKGAGSGGKSLARGINVKVTSTFFHCRGATEGEAGREVSSSYRLSWPEHKHMAQLDAASGVGSRHSQVQKSIQRVWRRK